MMGFLINKSEPIIKPKPKLNRFNNKIITNNLIFSLL